ncbi:MAG: ankyrin repeat domain-containing protein [Saprospiraceae bacterium]
MMKKLFFAICLILSTVAFSQNNLLEAVQTGNFVGVKKVLSSGVDVNQILEVNGQRMTSLSLASMQGDVEMVNLLLQKGAIVTLVVDQKDALMFAAQKGNREIVDILLNKGANVMNETRDGMTAWGFAQKGGHKELADMLLSEMKRITSEAKARAHARKK